jgi:hypothetical protein
VPLVDRDLSKLGNASPKKDLAGSLKREKSLVRLEATELNNKLVPYSLGYFRVLQPLLLST